MFVYLKTEGKGQVLKDLTLKEAMEEEISFKSEDYPISMVYFSKENNCLDGNSYVFYSLSNDKMNAIVFKDA